MKISSIFLLLIFLSFFYYSCESTTESSDDTVIVELAKEKLADQLGDKNGSASTEELNYVEEYFNTYNQMWVITNCMNREGETVKVQEVLEKFLVHSSAYPSEEKLRNENQGLSIRTPWIGITVIEKNDKIFITKTFRSPGPDYASAEWKILKIIK